MKNVIIEKDTRIPGTNVFLERGDRILYKEASSPFIDELSQLFEDNDLALIEKREGFYQVSWNAGGKSVLVEVDLDKRIATVSKGGKDLIRPFKFNPNSKEDARLLMNDIDNAGGFDPF